MYSNWYISSVYADWLLAGSFQQPVNINAVVSVVCCQVEVSVKS